MIRQDDDRRWRLAYVGPNAILLLFMDWSTPPDCINFMQLVGVPKDYVIDAVCYDPTLLSFMFLLYHPSFDVVEPGVLPPKVETEARVVSLPQGITK